MISTPIKPGIDSKWNAAFNPMVMSFERKDYLIEKILSTQSAVTTKAVLPDIVKSVLLDKTATVYIKTDEFEFSSKVDSLSDFGQGTRLILTDINYYGDGNNGYINIILSGHTASVVITPKRKMPVTANFATGPSGKTKIDVSYFYRSVLQPNDTFLHNSPAFLDTSLFKEADVYYQFNTAPIPNSSYVDLPGVKGTFAAMQFGSSGNLQDYLTYPDSLAKFLTDFDRPVYFDGLPFDLAFILSEYVYQTAIKVKFTPYDINGFVVTDGIIYGYLLMEDGSYILKEDGGKIVLESSVFAEEIISLPYGIVRLRLPYFSFVTSYIDVQVLSNNVPITEVKKVRCEVPCSGPFVYVKWMNSLGAYDYFRFGYNQLYSSDVDNETIVSRIIGDDGYSGPVSDVVKKAAVDKIQIGADDLTKDEANVIRWLRKSIMVDRLYSEADMPVVWQRVVVEGGSFDVYESRLKSSSAKITLQLPETNIQFQ